MSDDKRKKKRGISKIFRSCFRSFAADERPSSYDVSDGRNTKNGRLGKPVSIAVTGRKGKDITQDINLVNGGVADSGVDCSAERSSPRRRISCLLKGVLFDSVMLKKIRRSSSKSSIASETNVLYVSSEKIGKPFDVNKSDCIDLDDSRSRSNLLSSSSRTTCSSYSTSSSNNSNSLSSDQKTSSPIYLVDFRHPISSNSLTIKNSDPVNSNSRSCFDQNVSSKQLPLAQLNPDKFKSGSNNWNIRWCLFLLLSLVVLVIYGRIYSIICTSSWLYFIPFRRIKRVNSVTSKSVDTDSEQYKKRVIMAGLLDRTRNPLR